MGKTGADSHGGNSAVKNFRMKFTLPIFLAAMSLALAGCNGSGKKVIAVIPKATSHLFWVSVKTGAEAGHDDGVLFLVGGWRVLCKCRCSKCSNHCNTHRHAAGAVREAARIIKLELGHDSLP